MPYFEFQSMRLYYRLQGSGPLVVIIPGSTASSAHHTGELEYFSQQQRVAALDLPGTGRSARLAEWPDDWWELSAQAVAALIAELEAEQAVLVGTSGGGVIALLAAIQHPGCIRAVIADSCVAIYPTDALRLEVAGRDMGDPDLAAFWEAGHGGDWRHVVQADSDLLMRLAQRGGDWFGDRLNEIACPVLLTASLSDRSLPGGAEQNLVMAGQIPDCQLYFSNTGEHPLMWSRPGVFRSVADGFLVCQSGRMNFT